MRSRQHLQTLDVTLLDTVSIGVYDVYNESIRIIVCTIVVRTHRCRTEDTTQAASCEFPMLLVESFRFLDRVYIDIICA